MIHFTFQNFKIINAMIVTCCHNDVTYLVTLKSFNKFTNLVTEKLRIILVTNTQYNNQTL